MYTVDKTKWQRGPWDTEADQKQWDTPEGFHAIMLRTTQIGTLCGYIGVPPGHRWHGKSYRDLLVPTELQLRQKVDIDRRNIFGTFMAMIDGTEIGDPMPLDMIVRVHGGLTFSNGFRIERGGRKDWWYFGFDTAHCDDLTPGMTQYEWARASTSGVYRTEEYVTSEIEFLSRQMAIMQAPYIPPHASRNQREGWNAGHGKRTWNHTLRLGAKGM